jgi:two-component system heavy metal sensor histidine kinase CusS
MSSKSVPEHAASQTPGSQASATSSARTWSLAARLTAWYAGSAFALVLTATGFLYLASVRNLDLEDDQALGDRVRAVRAVMLQRPDDRAAMRQELEEEWEAHERTRVHLRIVDGDGKVFVETPGMSGVLPPASFPAAANEPGSGVDIKSVARAAQADADGDKAKFYRVLAVRAGENSPYVIQVALDRSERIRLLAEYRKNFFLVLAASLVVGTIVGYQIARRGLRPIYGIMDTTQRIRPTNLAERISTDGLPAELLTLANTFNEMLGRLERSFDQLSRFSADIAHELRTPVNNLRCGIEVALAKPRTVENYQDVLGSNLEECGRLTRIIDSLLFLAEAENPRTQVAKEVVDIGAELATVREFFDAAASEKQVALKVAVPHVVRAKLNRALFQRAVCNLVANAVSHTPPGGSVVLRASENGDSITAEVDDTGCGIPPDDLPFVFDRFFRADPVRSSAARNVGLGLAIVKSIVELHNGTVHITSDTGRGTRVTMSFPNKMSFPSKT